jgi:hypothetical protein
MIAAQAPALPALFRIAIGPTFEGSRQSNSDYGPPGHVALRTTGQGPKAAASLPDATRPLVRAKA